MKRIRISTLMLLVVIAALVVALVIQEKRAGRFQAEAASRELELRQRLSSPTFRHWNEQISANVKANPEGLEQLLGGATTDPQQPGPTNP